MQRADTPLSDDVRHQAAMWLLELQADGDNAELRARWQHWLESSPEHRYAWQAVEAFGERMGRLPPALAHAALSPGKSRRRAIKALAVLIGVGVGGGTWLAREAGQLPLLTADLRTAPGERRTVTLTDGSLLTLNTDTALDLRFGAQSRLLVLHRGEILVTTAPDPANRPFFVDAPQGRARALGTRYSVRTGSGQDGALTHVAVYEGSVVIEPRSDKAAALTLHAGQQTRFSDQAAEAPTAVAASTSAWARGILVAEDMPLDAFVAELSRLTGRTVRCDSSLNTLKVSGTYPLSDPDAVLDLLAAAHGLQIELRRRWWGGVEARLSPA
ncbi:FecR domain-containing protein [Ectothiorhodospira shaposhnikovii]|uniref:FecR domain-containing protein n=1 Tax=Ectothiorhodospira shaposhnikovii TaxID=1054 RepID=UPI001902E026|nr:FecR domain-containing protein [Ectothiorhodospira shaposhnikovii]